MVQPLWPIIKIIKQRLLSVLKRDAKLEKRRRGPGNSFPGLSPLQP